jgi:glucose/arabinose dehydrogenase
MKSLLLLLAFATAFRASAQSGVGGGKARDLYRQHCAICHGNNGEGGVGGNLIDDEWIHAQGDERIGEVIRNGLPDLGMLPFKDTIKDQDIRSLVIYLRELKHLAEKTPRQRPSMDAVQETTHHRYRLGVFARGPERFWGMDFLPSGEIIATETDGGVRLIGPDGTLGERLRDTPAIRRHGQGGMLDVAVHPDYAKNGWIYLSFSESHEEHRIMTAIARGRIRDGAWVDQEILFRAKPDHIGNAGVHFGSRLAFHDGYLFFSLGDRGNQDQAQDLKRPNGKIHRLHDDGRVPADNPFPDATYPSIWSYGHRNPQGLAFRPGTAELWSNEHGPRGGDELNLIRRGGNYGWPVITYGMNYDGRPITDMTHREGMEQPVWHWTPSIAVCGMAFVTPGKFPKWEGDLLVGGLQSEVVERLRPGADGLVEREVILRGLGRVRDIACAPDGTPHIVLESQGGQILRLLPAD